MLFSKPYINYPFLLLRLTVNMDAKIYYEFINSQTGDAIAHLSLSAALSKDEQTVKLEQKKFALATTHKLNLLLIYLQDKNHPTQ
ncbi:hypothetical protein KXD93_02790 [Mucilaginibacter sp. BJC16-A38]|uniref:hypothetical protein n=1 Tax=Mucilaginibacter phenanthrenivorans TaxID=1234842 RepID=UPI002157CF5A|nr:hypothetical protein [Mucilaginibacter phenanthrenivorans]MCR8556549.1 hypothetical protein [Mucilaginibacter phenanthrenivorans]